MVGIRNQSLPERGHGQMPTQEVKKYFKVDEPSWPTDICRDGRRCACVAKGTADISTDLWETGQGPDELDDAKMLTPLRSISYKAPMTAVTAVK